VVLAQWGKLPGAFYFPWCGGAKKGARDRRGGGQVGAKVGRFGSQQKRTVASGPKVENRGFRRGSESLAVLWIFGGLLGGPHRKNFHAPGATGALDWVWGFPGAWIGIGVAATGRSRGSVRGPRSSGGANAPVTGDEVQPPPPHPFPQFCHFSIFLAWSWPPPLPSCPSLFNLFSSFSFQSQLCPRGGARSLAGPIAPVARGRVSP